MNTYVSLFVIAVCLSSLTTCMVEGCSFSSNITDCSNDLTMDFFHAGSNTSKLCQAADTFIRCVDAYPPSCRTIHQYFQGMRHLNLKVTIDDCPELLQDDVPSHSTDSPMTSPSLCTCSATTTTPVSLILSFMILYCLYIITEHGS